MSNDYSIPISSAITQTGKIPSLKINHASATAEVYLQGAHITQWQPSGSEPVLFVSTRSNFAPGTPIRGGVPICFPWFATHATDPKLPAHGFARTRDWKLVSHDQTPDAVHLHLQLATDHATRELWGFDCLADFRLVIGKTLEMKLSITNTDKQPITFEEALHTYFTVSDVRKIAVTGLKGVTYLDKSNNMQRVVEAPDAIRFAGTVDRPYLNTAHTCTIDDPGMRRRIVIEKTGSQATVVWNPSSERGDNVPDIGPENWPGFVCVETANCFETAITLAPGRTHEIAAKIRVENF